MKRFSKLLVSIVFVILFSPVITSAADIQTGNSFEVGQTKTNPYLFGSNITVVSDTKGDLVAFGNEVVDQKAVEDSAFIGASKADIGGNIGQNLRVFAADTTIDGQVGSDLINFSGTYSASKQTKINGDAIIFAATAIVDGTVGGKTTIYANKVSLNGTFQGDVNIKAQEVTIGDNVQIKGRLAYSATLEAKIPSTAKIDGGVEFTKTKPAKTGFRALESVGGWLKFLEGIVGLSILAIILAMISAKWGDDTISYGEQHPFWSAIYGLIAAAVIPIAILLLLISSIGAWLGLGIAFAYGVALIAAYGFAALFFGKLILKLFQAKQQNVYLVSLVGAAALIIVSYIPYLGVWAAFVIYLIAFGSQVKTTTMQFRGKNNGAKQK